MEIDYPYKDGLFLIQLFQRDAGTVMVNWEGTSEVSRVLPEGKF